jgi:hypothetical protein
MAQSFYRKQKERGKADEAGEGERAKLSFCLMSAGKTFFHFNFSGFFLSFRFSRKFSSN